MKHLTKLLSLFAIASLIIFMSCGGNDGGGGDDDPTPENPPAQDAAEALSGTWGVNAGGVTNNGETRSEWEEAGFSVTLNVTDTDNYMSGTFSVSNLPEFEGFERIWPESGSWEFDGTDEDPNTGRVIRSDGIQMSVNVSGTSATFTFTVPEEAASVPGEWSFSFSK